MASFLPKNPFAAAGIGVLAGVGIAAYKLWMRAGQAQVDNRTVVKTLVQHAALFGTVAAMGTVSKKGGGVGFAALSVAGLGQGAAKTDVASMLSSVFSGVLQGATGGTGGTSGTGGAGHGGQPGGMSGGGMKGGGMKGGGRKGAQGASTLPELLLQDLLPPEPALVKGTVGPAPQPAAGTARKGVRKPRAVKARKASTRATPEEPV